MDHDISVEISRLYVSFFNRAADPEGLQYWVNRYSEAVAQGRDPKDFLEDIADSFAQSPEAKAIYETTANPTDAQIEAYIIEAYQNMFGRTPDDEGLAYWAGRWKAEMAEGKPGVRVLFEIENAARGSSNADDVAALQNKAEVAAKFTTDFIASGAEWTDEDFATAGSIVDGVDHTPESVQQANDQIAEFIENKTDPDGGQEPNQPGPVDPGPTNVAGAVTIDGDARVGEKLTAEVIDGNGLTGVTINYQWFAGNQLITGATSSTYTVDAETFGQKITVKATYIDNAGFSGTVEATTANDVSVGTGEDELPVRLFNGGSSVGYATIQEAIAAANANATILVKTGSYDGLVQVNKAGLTLLGEADTVLTGGVAFADTSDGSTLSGFKVSGVGDAGESSTIVVLAKDVTISRNEISQNAANENLTGVVIGGQANGAIIEENEISGFSWYGVYVNRDNTDAVVKGNTFKENTHESLVFEHGTKEVSGNNFDDSGADIRVSIRNNVEVDVSEVIGINNFGSDETIKIFASSGATVHGTDVGDIIKIVGSDYGTYENGSGATVNGGSGHDIIVGGRGRDVLNGGAGNDIIWGDNPNDNIRTNPNDYYGDDTINGGSGTNVIVLGTKGQSMKVGGQDTVVHDVADNATNIVFNFNFGPINRWDSVSSNTHGLTEESVTNGDKVFDIVSFLNVSGPIKISLGQDNSAYQDIVGDVATITESRDFEFDVAGNTVYTGNTLNLELVIEIGGSKLIFANAFSEWEIAAFLTKSGVSAAAAEGFPAISQKLRDYFVEKNYTDFEVSDGIVSLDAADATTLVGLFSDSSVYGNFLGI